jgi:hypothetical protein
MIERGIVIQMTQAVIAFMKSLRNHALQSSTSHLSLKSNSLHL